MRTSLPETRLIEMHLLQTALPEEALLFDAMLIIDPELKTRVLWQQKTMNAVTLYGRKTLKAEIAAVAEQLFTRPEHEGFRQRLRRIFFKS